MQASPLISLSSSFPSFNSYSSGKLAEIAARVVQEFENESESDTNTFSWDEEKHFPAPTQEDQEEKSEYIDKDQNGEDCTDDDDDDDFEFAIVSSEPDSSSVSADEIFYNGQIRPVYPLFNTDLLLNHEESTESSAVSNKTTKSIRLPLKKLFNEERESTSCSSSEADELDGVPSGMYCVWSPKKAEDAPAKCKKSSSAGSNSKRWKLRDLIYRSNSDGKETFLFLMPSKKNERLDAEGKENKEKTKKGKESEEVMEEHHCAKNRAAMKEGDKRRSFLPYRQDLVGPFSNVNGLSRNLHPF